MKRNEDVFVLSPPLLLPCLPTTPLDIFRYLEQEQAKLSRPAPLVIFYNSSLINGQQISLCSLIMQGDFFVVFFQIILQLLKNPCPFILFSTARRLNIKKIVAVFSSFWKKKTANKSLGFVFSKHLKRGKQKVLLSPPLCSSWSVLYWLESVF